MGTEVIARYRITYNNGVVQEKDLISHRDYDVIVKPRLDLIESLQKEKDKAAASRIKKDLFDMFGDNYFTDQSGLFRASITGVLNLPAHMGGNSKCTVVKIS